MNLEQFQIKNNQIKLNILTEQDANDIYLAMHTSLDVLRKFPASLPWALEKPDLLATQAFCKWALLELINKTKFIYSIRLNENNHFLGVMDIHDISWEKKSANVGFWGNVEYQGNGYLTEALTLFTRCMLDHYQFKNLFAYVDEENTKARKLCERTGFDLLEIQENVKRNPVDGSLRNICKYGIEH